VDGEWDNICGDGMRMEMLFMGMGTGWMGSGCKFIPVSIFTAGLMKKCPL